MDITSVVSGVTAIGFMFGVIFDLGYFATIDINFFLMLSFSDHLKTILLFIPTIFFAFGFIIVRQSIRRAADITACVLGVSTLFLWSARAYFVGYAPVMLGLWGAYVLIAYSAAILFSSALSEMNFGQAGGLERPTGDSHIRTSLSRLITDGPTILACVGIITLLGIFGSFAGRNQLRIGSRFDNTITLTNGSGTKPEVHLARVVRPLDNGLLLVFQDAPDQLAYIRYESVRAIAKPFTIGPNG